MFIFIAASLSKTMSNMNSNMEAIINKAMAENIESTITNAIERALIDIVSILITMFWNP